MNTHTLEATALRYEFDSYKEMKAGGA